MSKKKDFIVDKTRLNKFIDDYYEHFLPEVQGYLDEMKNNPDQISSFIMRQIYSYLHFLPSNTDCYRGFLKFLEATYGQLGDKHILDVAGGPFPTLAHLISRKQQNRQGTVTVYDSMLLRKKVGPVKSFIENIDEQTKINTFDLLTGFKSCEATKMIILKANQEGIPFAILTCDCIHDFGVNQDLLSDADYFKYYAEQINLYRYIAEQTLPDDMNLYMTKLPANYKYPCPLIYTLKKEKSH